MDDACPFCAIVSGVAPANVILDDGKVLAFMDWRQAVPGHVLVIPHRHVPDIYTLADDEAAALMQATVRVARALRAAYDPPGLNLWQSNGEAGGQEVFHFHLHVHPRRVDDGLLRVYPDAVPPRSGADQLAAIARTLKARLEH
ncbi:HIT family hydrolase [Rhodanobacter sp. Root480]|uniref:HIT family protein n=1 Tax=Rhodanobacter ginsenosidimutans TaxID=490571 RepID=A0ABW0JZQ8_9GAMM|nr:HIT family protein [Rhodanobacter sp. Root480]KQX96574.1 HIT family hydrolase [Rhodanobacter sp. Root480]